MEREAQQKDCSMRSLAHRVSATRNVGLDYDRAGDRYRAYADGDADKLYDFDGQYAYGDREIWRIAGSTLNALRAKGARELSVLDRCRERTVPEFGNLAGKRFWATSAAQDDFMASGQGFPNERQCDSACADRSELHDPAS